jgi:hypothetical protein
MLISALPPGLDGAFDGTHDCVLGYVFLIVFEKRTSAAEAIKHQSCPN